METKLLFVAALIILFFLIHYRRLRYYVVKTTNDLIKSKKELEKDKIRSEYLLELVRQTWESENKLTTAALEMCVNLTDSEVGYFHFIEKDNDNKYSIRLHTWSKSTIAFCEAERKEHYDIDKAGIWADCVRTGKPAVHNNEPKDGWKFPPGHFPLKRHISIPVKDNNNEIVAVVGVGNKNLSYTEEDINNLTIFVNSIWAAFKQRESDEKLKDSERKLGGIFNNHYQLTWLLDKSGKLLMANKTSLDLVDLNLEEVLNKNFENTPWFFHSSEEQEKVRFNIKEALNGSFLRWEASHIDSNKEKKIVDISIKPIKDQDGIIEYLLLESRDITSQKIYEEELKETRAILKAAMDHSTAGIAIADAPDGTLRYVNTAGLLIGGASKEELVNNIDSEKYVSAWNILKTDGTPYNVNDVPLTKTIVTGLPVSEEFIIRSKDNKDKIVLANAAPIFDSDNKIQAGIVIFIDVTADRIREKKLIENEHLLKMSQRIAKLGHWEYDINKKFLKWSEEVYHIFQAIKEEGVSCWGKFIKRVHVDDRNIVESRFLNHLKTNENYDLVYRITLNNGEIRYIHEKCRTQRNSLGVAITSLGTCQDVTERVLWEQQLKEKEEEKKIIEFRLQQAQKLEAIGTLAGGIAHDFNNILSIIMGNADILLAKIDKKDFNTVEQNVEKILNAGHRAKDLISQILLFGRKSEKDLRPVQLHLIVKECLKLLRASFPATIEFKQNIENCGSVLGDYTEIHQIIMNLCTNAYHSMKITGGVISVKLNIIEIHPTDIKVIKLKLTPGLYIKLSVSDTGSGIPKDILPKIFDPYFTTKKQGEGSGLGLSIVHGIVKNYKGDISVYTEIDKGSTFCVYIPKTENVKIDSVVDNNTLVGGTETIMVVDDEQELINIAVTILKGFGYTVYSFINSEEALKEFKKDPFKFDLILTDMTMPRLTGTELAKEVLKLRPQFPIILCTGFSDLINEELAKKIGIAEFCMKPVLRKPLSKVLRKLLD